MKEIVLIGSYCDTTEKLEALEKQIDDLKLLDLDVLVFGRYPLPPHIYKKCDYFIYDKSNPITTIRRSANYLLTFGKRIESIFDDYGYAALEQIIKSLGFAKSLNYDIAHWLVYDVDVTEFPKFRDLSLKKLKNHDVIYHKFYPEENIQSGVDGTSISFKVHTSYDKLKGVITKTFYEDLIRKNGFNSTAEDFTEECFRISEMATYLVNPKPNLPARIASTSSNGRVFGSVPKSSTKSLKYFKRCFIGRDCNTNQYVIWIDNLFKKVEEIEFQIKDNIIISKKVQMNSDGGIEIIIDKADMLKIISINGEKINELMDEKLDDKYYSKNLINNAPKLPSQVLPTFKQYQIK